MTWKPTGKWRPGTNASPRWGKRYTDEEVMDKVNAMAERVGKTEPKPLRKCSRCGGWATATCEHGSTA